MKIFISFSALLISLGTSLVAHAGSVTREAMDQEVATNRALSHVPAGKSVTDTSCQEIQMGLFGDTSYRCTVTWD
ncbi:MAG: hypothetical protein CMN98_00210 [Synechococcus sp. NP17]|nr:hypothetical protein [Synechococcus sp. NP17]|tara:strand:- start:145 stop:369 length:225 start_codon:yes stop_codon:yes gene_type:complete